MLKHPDDLQDKDILLALDASRGAGVQWGAFVLQKRNGEPPIQFIARVKGEYRAWYESQEAEKVRQARASQVSNGAKHPGPSVIVPTLAQAPATSETSLGSFLKGRIAELTLRKDAVEATIRSLGRELEDCQVRSIAIDRDLEITMKFLKELEEGERTPAVPAQTGEDIPREVGQRKPRGRPRMGSKDNTTGRGSQDKGASKEAKGTAGEVASLEL